MDKTPEEQIDYPDVQSDRSKEIKKELNQMYERVGLETQKMRDCYAKSKEQLSAMGGHQRNVDKLLKDITVLLTELETEAQKPKL